MKDISKHLPHYLSLLGIIILAAFGFYYFSWDKSFQLAILVGVAVSYVSWGMTHHFIHKDLTLSVILEYIAVALLGLTIVTSLIIRG